MPRDHKVPAVVPRDWVLVANAARARCFLHDPGNQALQELHSFVHPASRLKAADLASDRGGQVRKSAASTRLAPRTEPHDKQLRAFARDLAAYLEDAAQSHRCGRLSLIVSKELLGELRAQLGTATRALPGVSIGLDLTGWEGSALEHHVARALKDAAGDQP